MKEIKWILQQENSNELPTLKQVEMLKSEKKKYTKTLESLPINICFKS